MLRFILGYVLGIVTFYFITKHYLLKLDKDFNKNIDNIHKI